MICNLSSGWIGKVGQKRSAWIRGHACFGHKAKAVQRNSSLRARIESHVLRSVLPVLRLVLHDIQHPLPSTMNEE
jgi:hypothetical protein